MGWGIEKINSLKSYPERQYFLRSIFYTGMKYLINGGKLVKFKVGNARFGICVCTIPWSQGSLEGASLVQNKKAKENSTITIILL